MIQKVLYEDASLESRQKSPNLGMVGIVDDDADISMLFADTTNGNV